MKTTDWDSVKGTVGAGILRTQVEFFRLGMNRTLPAKWVQFMHELERQNDPEWHTYQRLKAKFGD